MSEIDAEYYTYTGFVTEVGKTQEIGANKFKKRILVVDKRNEKWENPIQFVFTRDNVARLEGLELNDIVKVHFTLRGRRWQDKIFGDLDAWKVDIIEKQSKPAESQGASITNDGEIDNLDDMPF